MTFLHPILAAAAIASVSIPIIIHILMRRRRRPVMWAAMRFLQEAYRQHRRRLRLEQILLLAARCLVVVLAGLAIARPLVGRAGLLGGRGAVTLYLLVDNSLTAGALDDAGKPALERHKAAALSLLDQLDFGAGDRAALIAVGGPAQGLVVPPSTSGAGLRDLISGLTVTDSSADLAGAVAMVRSALDGEQARGGRTVVAVLSDFLAGSADTERRLTELAPAEGAGDLVIVASAVAERGVPNVTLVGIEPLRPVVIAPRRDGGSASEAASVRILLRRSGPETGEAAASAVRLALHADGRGQPMPAGQALVRWAPGQSEATATASIDLGSAGGAGPSGSVVLTAAIDNDAVPGDNVFRRPIEVRESLRVGIVAPRRTGAARPGVSQFEPADWFRLALAPTDPTAAAEESEIEIVEIEPVALDAGRLAGLDAALVLRPEAIPEGSWRRLRAFADSGGLVLICPPPHATVHLWADAMVRDLGVPWTVAREAKVYPEPVAVASDRPSVPASRDLLALLEAELRDLLAPVRVFRVLPVEVATGAGAPVLAAADGTPLILASAPGTREAPAPGQPEPPQRGLVVLMTVAMHFDWTDLQARPFMVALSHELVKQGVGRARGGRTEIAGTSPEIPARGVELRAIGESQPAVVRAQAGRTDQPLRRAGIWRATDESGATRALLAVNPDPAGGRTDAQPRAAIAAWLGRAAGEVRWLEEPGRPSEAGAGDIGTVLQSGDDSGRLVLPLLIAAAALAVLELAMARWFSHAVVRGGAAS